MSEINEIFSHKVESLSYISLALYRNFRSFRKPGIRGAGVQGGGSARKGAKRRKISNDIRFM